MEDKQLNFSQPLLSVRRFSPVLISEKDVKKKTGIIPSMPPVPSYKSEMISGPITNAGTVPFVWEQIPGRPKNEKSPQVHITNRTATTVQKLPPGRTFKPKRQDNDNVRGEKLFGPQCIVPLLDETNKKVDFSKKKLKDHNSDSGDGDEVYMDALDTLSRAESSFYNCSVDGLSGVDLDLKPYKTVSIDPKTRDFMMDRFLPAAKAMASDAPQHAPRKKQPMVWDQPRQVKKLVNAKEWVPLRYGPNYVQDYADNNAKEESDNECDEYENTSFKVCGLLPRFALKGSFCLLNPVPGMSQRTRVPLSNVGRIMQASSISQAGSCNESEKEPARVAIYEQRPVHGIQATEQPKDKRVSRSESCQIPDQSNSQKLEGSILYKRLQGNNGLSTHHHDSSECLVDEKEGYTGRLDGPNGTHPRRVLNTFKELLADQTDSVEIESGSLISEKTVYVDIVHKVGSEQKNSRLSGMNGLGENPFAHSLVKDSESLTVPCGESNEDVEIETMKDFAKGTKYNSITKVADYMNHDFNTLPENSKHSHGSFSKLPPPPPLPKSPSDSWLFRTLPSVPSKNATFRSNLGTRAKPYSKTSSTDPKWEKVVTFIETKHQHSQFAEGGFMSALTPIPET